MRLNGGILGRANEPSLITAGGIWSSKERELQQLYGNFPRFYEGWSLRNVAGRQIVLTSSFSVGAQEGGPSGIAFKSDGTKMYVVGTSGDEVNEYTLSTAWDVSSASYVQNFSILTQAGNSQGIAFKPDGTKMYIVGNASDSVHEYTLSTAWDVSSASYTQSLSVSTEETAASGIDFKPDGTKMYIVGASGDDINEYTLSTAWDISSATYVTSKYVGTETIAPSDIRFSNDGFRVFISESVGDEKIFQYDLSTAWDISSATYNGISFSTVSQDNPYGFAFKSDGTELYIIGVATDTVYQYSLYSPWDLETPGFIDSQSFSVGTQESAPEGIAFKPDGSKMYVVGTSGDEVNEYALSTAWDVSSATYIQSFSVATQEITPTGLAFKPDGSKMFIVGRDGDDVNEYTLSTAWDVSSATYIQNFYVGSQEINPTGLAFKPDGTKMYVVGTTGDDVNEYTLSTAWDVSSATYIQSFGVSAQEGIPDGVAFSPDGSKMFIVGRDGDDVNEYTLSTAWDVSSATYTNNYFIVSRQGEASPAGVAFKEPDGSIMYIVGPGSNKVYQYYLG